MPPAGSKLYAGAMSGTSLDGVDATLIDFGKPIAKGKPCLIHRPYPPELREELFSLCQGGPDELARCQEAARGVSEVYAAAVNDLLAQEGCDRNRIRAIGCHGQTVRHAPERGWTVQLLNAHALAEQTGIPVAFDFRGRDMARGGQGAPIAPLFHAVAFSQDKAETAVVNIGGIANLTLLPPRASSEPLRAYDVGPGGVLMDFWTERHQDQPYDRDGLWASRGKCVEPMLERMLAAPYFHQKPPKSTGRELFNAQWLVQFDAEKCEPVDVQATLLELTAKTIASGMIAHGRPHRAVLCGGGAKNTALRDRITELLAGHCEVVTSAGLGFPENWVEPATCAYLAMLRAEETPIDTASITGGRAGGHVAGAMVPADRAD